MPCDTVQTNTVELQNVKDLDLLEKALRAEFGNVNRPAIHQGRFTFNAAGVRVELANGRASSTLPTSDLEKVVGRVKQAYAREAVALSAKRFGWAIVKGADVNHFQIVKR